jgi:hypothetical protein
MSDPGEEFLIHGAKVNTVKNFWSVGEYFYNRLEAGGDNVAQIVEVRINYLITNKGILILFELSQKT